jgi:hypothetical protein
MSQKTFQVPTVVTDEDRSVLENGLRQLPGVRHVEFQPGTKSVSVEWLEPTDWEEIRATLETLGYPPEA